MKLYLKGHDYKYAAEQIMMAVLPDTRPEYSDTKPEDGEDWAQVSLNIGGTYAAAVTQLSWKGKDGRGEARTPVKTFENEIEKNRQLQKIVKLSFYRAALQVLPEEPAWGALTGIRPGTLMTRMLEKGISDRAAVNRMCREYYLRRDKAELCLSTAKKALEVEENLDGKDIAIYVGIPFCPTRCAYCSFVSQSVEKSMGLIEPYLEALWREMDRVAEITRTLGLRVKAVYIGGGTPTTLSAGQIAELLDRLYGNFDLSCSQEFSVEAGRPDTITADKLRAMSGKVTRISINPQSMEPHVLEAIGRKHRPEDIRQAYRMARTEFPGEINMDLIAGLPGDTPDGFYRTISEIIGLEPENITVHTLALKRGSKMTTENIARPGKPQVEEMLSKGSSALKSAGYGPYYLYRQKFMAGGFENVGWAKRGHESLYNILIMEELCSIFAMGGGGSTKLVNRSRGVVNRIFDPKYPKEYIDGIGKTISAKDEIVKFYI